jgi:hypothetical protein
MTGATSEVGDGYFFVHVQEVLGVVPHVSLESVIVLDDGRCAVKSGQRLLAALQDSQGSAPANLTTSADGLLAAEKIAAAEMARRRDAVAADARLRNDAVLAARSAAINASFDAKIRRTEELLGQATEDRIKRMRLGQIENLRSRREAKLEELQQGRDVTVSSDLIAAGRVRIVAREPGAA